MACQDRSGHRFARSEKAWRARFAIRSNLAVNSGGELSLSVSDRLTRYVPLRAVIVSE